MKVCIDADQTTPTFFSFILTNELGTRDYGACLTIYETLSAEQRKKLETSYYIEKLKVFAPKSLCIISSYPFITQFKEILKQIYRLHLSQCPIPIERYICNFVDEIPIPVKGKTLVQYEIGTSSISFSRPLDQIPPYASVNPYLIDRAKIMNTCSCH